MAPRNYENHTFSLNTAFGASQNASDNPAENATMLTFNSKAGFIVQKPRRRANTMPWDQGRLSFANNPSDLGHTSSTHPDFQHGLHTPRTPSNAFGQAMDVDFPDEQTNDEHYSGLDWHADVRKNSPQLHFARNLHAIHNTIAKQGRSKADDTVLVIERAQKVHWQP